jgi:poly(3-hydroxybutyrate) depolymerase
VLGLLGALSIALTGGAAAQPPSEECLARSDESVSVLAPGEHTLACDGLTYQVTLDESCADGGCGLIVDIHGASMSGRVMRDATQLHLLAPRHGYVVVQPSARPNDQLGAWDLAADPPKMRAFVDRLIEELRIDERRVHFTGFSMGAAMTFAFLCHHNDLLASVAVATGSSADQVRARDGTRRCVDAFDADWRPRVPILFMNGVHDPALRSDAAQARTDRIAAGLGLEGPDTVEIVDGHYRRRRWSASDGMVLDFLEHEYSTEGRLAGHCMPRGELLPGAAETLASNAVVCTTGAPRLHWGEVALAWFREHPRVTE